MWTSTSYHWLSRRFASPTLRGGIHGNCMQYISYPIRMAMAMAYGYTCGGFRRLLHDCVISVNFPQRK